MRSTVGRISRDRSCLPFTALLKTVSGYLRIYALVKLSVCTGGKSIARSTYC